MAGRLEGKVAFISGGARGQGRSHALRLAEEGADIITFDLAGPLETSTVPPASPEDLAETVRQVEALDRRIIARQADVRDFNAVKAVADEGIAELGRLDIVAGNAGMSGEMNPSSVMSEDGWRTMIDVNLTGVWHTAKAAIPHIQAGGNGGSIVLTSSVAGLKGMANISAYASAKHGLVGLMRTLALELAPDNIRVNSIHPTQVDTPMIMNPTTKSLFTGGVEGTTDDDFAAVSQSMNTLPIPWIDARDISNALLFLSSDEGRYITGVALPVDAGATLK